MYWHGPVGVYGAEFPRHLGAKPQIYDNETLDLINLLSVLPSGIYVCSFSLYTKLYIPSTLKSSLCSGTQNEFYFDQKKHTLKTKLTTFSLLCKVVVGLGTI